MNMILEMSYKAEPRITIITEDKSYDEIAREFIHELLFINKDVAWDFANKMSEFPFGNYDKEIINMIIKYDKKYNVNFIRYCNKDEYQFEE